MENPERVYRVAVGVGAGANAQLASDEAARNLGSWRAEGGGIEAQADSENEAVAAWRNARGVRLSVPRHATEGALAEQIRQGIRAIPDGPTIIDVGFVDAADGCYARVYTEREGPRVTPTWLEAAAEVIRGVVAA